MHPAELAFLPAAAIIIPMASGMWVVLVIPAIIAFLFGAWVLYSIMVDVSEREISPFRIVGPDRVRITVDPGE
jgi:hypothetical protein